MSEHNHVLRGDHLGCPACDYVAGRLATQAPEPIRVYPQLDPAEFNARAETFGGIPFHQDENGMYLFAYGHIDPALFALAMTGWCRASDPRPDGVGFSADDVTHTYAVLITEDRDEWSISWAVEYGDHPERFPVTVVIT